MVGRNKSNQRGFTLIELMVVVAIIAILAAIAVPAFVKYQIKAKSAEMMNFAANLKTPITLCLTAGNANCSGGNNDVPNVSATTGKYTASLAISNAGVVTAIGNADQGGETYILTPTYENGVVSWTATGTCVTNGNCAAK